MSSDSRDAPASLHIELLGGLRVRVGERTIAANEWKQRKGRALLNLLALAPGHRLHREQVLEVLWPDLEPDAASNNLNRVVYAVRRLLEPDLAPNQLSTYLHTEDNLLALRAPGGVWVDTAAFEQAARAARAERNTPGYEAALALYGGDLLPEERYEEWSFGARERLRQVYLTLLEELAHLWLSLGEPGAAIAAFERLLASEPVHEGAHLALMRLYAQTGRRYQALRQYQRLRAVLQRELDVAPDAQSQRLATAIRSGAYPAEGDFLPWSSSPLWQVSAPATPPLAEVPAETAAFLIPSAARTNLVGQATSFIGRGDELATVARQLARTRLLTLRGGGGCGKTRLAWQVAASHLEAYRDGVWMVELASLVNPALVPQAVAGALGIREVTGQPLSATVVEALRGRELLLVLDNCEHLLEAVATLARAVLAGCPHVRVLATSRRPLKVHGELVWRVPSMTTPDPDALPPFEELLAHDAIGLFVARATASRPTFRLTPLNALAVVRVCFRLDGIPLAIELAAGRCHVLNADQIAARLDDAFAVLARGGGDQLPRQQTLRASIAWSYDLLNASEQTLFRRLAVFSGGWTLEAVEAICAGDGFPAGTVLDALGGLVEASLVISEEHADGMRYRMLEMTRQYAHERLCAAGQLEEIERRHVEWYTALTEKAEPFIVQTHEHVWRERLERELDNLRAALTWAQRGGHCAVGLRLAGALARYWYLSNRLTEGRRWLGAMLALRGSDTFARPLAKAHYQAGVLALFQADMEQATGHGERSLALYRALDDWPGVIDALNILGGAAELSGVYEQATHYYTQCAALARKHDDLSRVALATSNLADVATAEGDFVRATRLYGECLDLARKAGETRKIAMALVNLGRMALQRGEARLASGLLEEALVMARAGQDSRAIAETLLVLARVAHQEQSYDVAHVRYVEALRLYDEAGNQIGIAQCLEGLAWTVVPQAQAALAARLLGSAEAIRDLTGAPLGPGDRLWYDPLVAGVRVALSEQEFVAAWAGGRGTPLEQVVAEALRDDTPSAEPGPRPRRRSKPRQPGASAPLAPREREVAALIAAGLTNREIAKQLRIAERTIDTHVSNILSKLDARHREQIAAWWRQNTTGQPSGS